MRASVVMACRNGEEHLLEAFEAIAAQEWDQPWEFVFADNGSTDASWRIFQDFAARHPHIPMVGVDASQRAGKSHALNLGVAAARADAIVLCDSDDVPAAGWLRAMAEALQRQDFVSARNDLDRLNTGPTGQYRTVSEDGIWQLRFAPFSLCTAGATMGFTKRVFEAVGGFDPDFQPEDDEFCIRAGLAGFRLQSVPGAVLHYRLRSDLASIYKQGYDYAKCDVKVAQRYASPSPAQLAPWLGLLAACRKTGLRYLRWRLGRGRRNMAEAARVHWKLGVLAGQFAGAVAYRAAPTAGLPPREPAAATPLFAAGHPTA